MGLRRRVPTGGPRSRRSRLLSPTARLRNHRLRRQNAAACAALSNQSTAWRRLSATLRTRMRTNTRRRLRTDVLRHHASHLASYVGGPRC
eukprot:3623225-Pleurochrysis_carterae.AAC.1